MVKLDSFCIVFFSVILFALIAKTEGRRLIAGSTEMVPQKDNNKMKKSYSSSRRKTRKLGDENGIEWMEENYLNLEDTDPPVNVVDIQDHVDMTTSYGNNVNGQDQDQGQGGRDGSFYTTTTMPMPMVMPNIDLTNMHTYSSTLRPTTITYTIDPTLTVYNMPTTTSVDGENDGQYTWEYMTVPLPSDTRTSSEGGKVRWRHYNLHNLNLDE